MLLKSLNCFILFFKSPAFTPVVWLRQFEMVILPFPALLSCGKNLPTVSVIFNLPSSTKVIIKAAVSHLLQLAIAILLSSSKLPIISFLSLPIFLAINLPFIFCLRLMSFSVLLKIILPSL